MPSKKIILLDVPVEDETNKSEEILEEVPEEELVPLAAEEIGAPVSSAAKLQSVMADLWKNQEPQQPPAYNPPPPMPPPPQVAPLPLVEKLDEKERRPFKSFGPYDRKAQWMGQQPTEDEEYFQVLCVGQGCRKPTWTRKQTEDVCEECYLTIQKVLDMGKQQGHHSTYSGRIGWYQS